MVPDDRRIRALAAVVLGGLPAGLLSYRAPYLAQVLFMALLGSVAAFVGFEVLDWSSSRIETDSLLVTVLYESFVVAIVVGGAITIVLGGTVLTTDMRGCLKNTEAPATNTFTGECELVRRDCSADRDIPWFYEDGCAASELPVESCKRAIVLLCRTADRIEQPPQCGDAAMPQQLDPRNGTIACP